MFSSPGHPLLHSLGRLALWLALTTGAAALTGHALAGFATGLAMALGWHYWKLTRLLGQLGSHRRLPAPQGWGLHAEIAMQLYRRQREAQRRRQRLRALLQAFRRAAGAIPDGVLVLARQSLRIEWFNPGAARLLGLGPGDTGVRLRHLVRSPRVGEWLDGNAAEPLLDLPAPHAPDLRLSLRLLDYSADQQLLVVRDVSKLMQLEQVRRDFVANVSHELRTPLTVVHGYLDMLDPADQPEWADALTEMRRQSTRMTQLVEDLLTLSRLDAQQPLAAEPVAMAPLLAALCREAEALSGGRHRIALDDDGRLDLLGAADKLHSAFGNLVSNAIRHTPAGGHVRIGFAATADGGARFSVTDTGPGIPAHHLPRLTERFYRVSSSRSRESGGTGLGLAIVKHVLALHHAHLQIDSTIGVGSCFACVFRAGQALPRGAADAFD